MTHSGFPKIAWIRDSLSIRRKFSILPQLPKGRLLISPRALQSKTDIRQLVPKDSQPWGGGVGGEGAISQTCAIRRENKRQSPLHWISNPQGMSCKASLQINSQAQCQQQKKRHWLSSLPINPKGRLQREASVLYMKNRCGFQWREPCFLF